MRVAGLVAAALLAFAGNSILCRAALAGGHADPASFTLVRVLSGAGALVLLARLRGASLAAARRGTAARASALFAYAALFSFAYVRIPAGVGALVLFACVQATMLVAAVRAGVGPRRAQWAGILLALGGLAVLTLPGATAPDGAGLVLMAGSGIAWGLYTLLGARAALPLAATATAFRGAVLPAVLAAGIGAAAGGLRLDAAGLGLAALSGAVASGLGYAVWYAVLPAIGTTRAAAIQLAVPVVAALAGILVLGEPASLRLAAAGLAVLGGVALATGRPRSTGRSSPRSSPRD